MNHQHPYKHTLIGLLLGFCYAEDGRAYYENGLIPVPAFADPKTLDSYPNKEDFRNAVVEVLREHIRSTSDTYAKRAHNTLKDDELWPSDPEIQIKKDSIRFI